MEKMQVQQDLENSKNSYHLDRRSESIKAPLLPLGCRFYIPTMWGDISLKAEEKATVVTGAELTPLEEEIWAELKKRYAEKLLSSDEKTLKLDVPLTRVHKWLVKRLKKNAPVLTAVRLAGGKVEVVESLEKLPEKAEVVATVEKPTRGCPMSLYERKEVRAQCVLLEFCTPRQAASVQKAGTLVALGSVTGKPYLIAHRNSAAGQRQGTLYDVLKRERLCEHCYHLPAHEEMLALKLMIEHRERELVRA